MTDQPVSTLTVRGLTAVDLRRVLGVIPLRPGISIDATIPHAEPAPDADPLVMPPTITVAELATYIVGLRPARVALVAPAGSRSSALGSLEMLAVMLGSERIKSYQRTNGREVVELSTGHTVAVTTAEEETRRGDAATVVFVVAPREYTAAMHALTATVPSFTLND